MFGKLITKRAGRPDYFIVVCLALLVAFGLIMLASASSNLGKIRFDDTYYFLKRQLQYGLALGLVFFFLCSRIYYRRYEKLAIVFLLISIALLSLIYTPLGVSAKGATRWLDFGIIFQPSEIIKLTFLIYLAAWLSRKAERQKDFWRGFVPFICLLAIIGALLFQQPATSTAIILIFTALIVYFMSGARWSYIFGIALTAILAVAILIYATPYRMQRFLTFLNRDANTQTSSFHINQALNAIGSGGLTGVGYGQSTTKLRYLPEPHGDSIFAVIAEEIGFLGASVLIIIFFALVLRIFLLAQRCSDKFGQLLLIGFGSLIAIQAGVHIAAISGLLPLTGTPLPFISFGSTALVIFMTMGGIIVNISKYV